MNDPTHAPADHLAALTKSLAVFVGTAKAYPRELVRQKPTEIAFSATEIVYHMRDVERLWQRRMRGVLDGSMTHFQQMDPDREAREGRYNERPYEDGIAELEKARQETHSLVRGLTGSQMNLSGIHSKYGEMNIHRMLDTMEGHDLQHAAQLARTLKEVSQ